MKMTVGRVLWLVAVVFLFAAGAFLALSFATGGTTRLVTGKTFLYAYFAFMGPLPICLVALIVKPILPLIKAWRGPRHAGALAKHLAIVW